MGALTPLDLMTQMAEMAGTQCLSGPMSACIGRYGMILGVIPACDLCLVHTVQHIKLGLI